MTPDASRVDSEFDFTLELPARRENVAAVRHVIGAIADVRPIDRTRMDDIMLALSEATTNAVLHAYGEDPGPMRVGARLEDERLVLCVSDSGRGMAPRPDSPGLGMGLAVMGSLADTVSVAGNDPEGTSVWMTFELDGGSEN